MKESKENSAHRRILLRNNKRCAMCKRTRADGATIYNGQGYCTDCRRLYQQEQRAKTKKPGKPTS